VNRTPTLLAHKASERTMQALHPTELYSQSYEETRVDINNKPHCGSEPNLIYTTLQYYSNVQLSQTLQQAHCMPPHTTHN